MGAQKIHYKMYKAKKNIVYASLFTAGLIPSLMLSQQTLADTQINGANMQANINTTSTNKLSVPAIQITPKNVNTSSQTTTSTNTQNNSKSVNSSDTSVTPVLNATANNQQQTQIAKPTNEYVANADYSNSSNHTTQNNVSNQNDNFVNNTTNTQANLVTANKSTVNTNSQNKKGQDSTQTLTDIQKNNALNTNNSGTASTAIINPSSDNTDSVEQAAQNVAVGYLPKSDSDIGKNYYLPYGKDWKDDQNPDANRLNYLQLGAYDVTQNTLPNALKSAMPTDVDQIPLTFKPGLLVYNPDTDKSAKIGSNGLSNDQIKLLTSMLLSWSNDFRQEVYRLYPELYSKLTKTDLRQGDSNLPLPVINTNRSQALGNAIAKLREENNLDNDTHTAVALNDQINALFDQYSFSTDKLNNTVKNLFKDDNAYKGNFSDIVSNASFVGEALPSEDLETMLAQNGTLLNYAINLYNMTQAMYWSETLRLGGHAISALTNSNHVLAISFQKLNKINNANGATKSKYPAYAVTSNWIGIGYYVLNNNLEGKLHNFELNLPNYYSQIYGTEIDNSKFNQIKDKQLPQLVKKIASNKTTALTHGQLLNLNDYQMPLTSAEKNNNTINKAYQFTFNSNNDLNTNNVLTMRYTNLNNATFKLQNGQSVSIDAIEYHFSNIVPINDNQKVAIRLYDTPNGFSTTNIKSIDMTPYYFTKDQNGDYQQIDPTNGVVYVTNLSTKYASLAKAPKLTGKIIFPANTPLPDAKSVIENYADYPNAKFKWTDNNIPVLGQTSKDLIIDFLNGDSETIKVPITVLPMNKFYQPQLQLKKQQSYQYNELPTPDSFITNANILPSGTEITFDKLGTPNATSKSKNQLAVIKIAYPDGTIGYNTVTLNLNLMASQYVIVGKSIVSNYGVLPNASSALDTSRSYLPESNKYTVSWVEPIDTNKTGYSMYHIKVTFTDGSSLVTSAGVTINAPSSTNYNLSLDPMKRATAGEEEPASYFVTAGLPGGTKYEWVKAPDFNTPGTQDVTIKATFPDGSTKTVSGSIEVDFNFGFMATSNTTSSNNTVEPAYQTLDLTDYWNRVKSQKFTANTTKQNQVAFLSNLSVMPSSDNIVNESYQLPSNIILTNRYNADHTILNTSVSATNDDSLVAINGNTTINNGNTSDSIYSSDNGVIAVKFNGDNPVLRFNVNGDDASNETAYFGLSTVANNNWSQLLATQPTISDITKTLKRYITIVNPDGTKQVIEQNANSISTKTGYLWTPTTFDAYDAPKIAGYKANSINSTTGTHDLYDTILYQPTQNVNTEATVTVTYQFIDSNGNVLKTSTFKGPKNSTQSISLKLPEGFKLVNNNQLPNQLTFNQDQTITFNVEPIKKVATVNLIYQLADGTTIDSKTISNHYVNDTIDLNYPVPDGYRLVKNQNGFPKSITINSENETLTQIIEAIPEQGTTTYQLVDPNGNTIKTVVISGDLNSQVTITNEFQLSDDYDANSIPTSVTIDNETHTLNLKYNPNKLATTTYTFNDATNNNQQIGDALTFTGLKGDSKETSFNLPNGYQLADTNILPNTVTFDNQTHKIEVKPIIKTVSTTLQFVDENNQIVGKPLTLTGDENSSQNVSLTLPAHYKLLDGETLPDKVTLKNTTISIKVALISSTLLIHLVSLDGSIDETKKFEGYAGTTIIPNITIPKGYALSKGQIIPKNYQLTDNDTTLTLQLTRSQAKKTINLVDFISGKIVSTYSLTGMLDEKQTFTPNIPSNYQLMEEAPKAITFDNNPLTLKVGQKAVDSINIVDNDGEILFATNLSGFVGEKKEFSFDLPEHYHLTDQIPSELTLVPNTTVTYHAEKNETASVTIIYRNSNTNKEITRQVLTGDKGTNIDFTPKDISGFNLPNNVPAKVTFNNQTITIDCLAAPINPHDNSGDGDHKNEGTVTINLVDPDQNILASVKVTGTVGSTQKLNNNLQMPDGYQFVKSTDKIPTSVSIKNNGSSTINMQIEKIPQKTVNMIIAFVDKDTTHQIGKYTISGVENQEYALNNLQVPNGYHLADGASLPTKVTLQNTTMNIYVVSNTPAKQPATYNFTLVDSDGNQISNFSGTGYAGDVINIAENLKLTADYSLASGVTLPTTFTLKAGENSEEFKVIKNAPEDISENIIINDDNGQMRIKLTINGPKGSQQPISMNDLQIPAGYHLAEKLPSTILMDGKDHAFNLVKDNTKPVKQNAYVTVQYIDETGNVIGSHEFTGKPNQQETNINTEQFIPEGYWPGTQNEAKFKATSLTFGNANTNTTAKMTVMKKTASTITYHFMNDSSEVGQGQTVNGVNGSITNETLTAPSGYVFVENGQTTISKSPTFTDQNQNINIAIKADPNAQKPFDNTADLTVEYVTTDGTVLSSKKFSVNDFKGQDTMALPMDLPMPSGYTAKNDDVPKSILLHPGLHDTQKIIVVPSNQQNSVLIKYTVQNTGEVIGTQTVNGKVNSTVSVSLTAPHGYTLVGDKTLKIIIPSTAGLFQTVYVTANAPTQATHNIKFNYNGTIIQTITISGTPDSIVELTGKNAISIPKGYKLMQNSQLPTSVKMDNQDTIVYLESATPVKQAAKLTLVYVDATDKVLGQQVITGYEGDIKQVVLGLPKGYRVATGFTAPKSVTLTAGDHTKSILVEEDPTQMVTQHINLVDPNGRTLIGASIHGLKGSAVNVDLKLPEGYELVDKSQTIPTTVTLTGTDINIKIKPIHTEPVKETATYQFRLLDQNGKVLASQSGSGYAGDVIKLHLSVPEDYTANIPDEIMLVKGSNNKDFTASYKYGENIDQIINFVDTKSRNLGQMTINAPEGSLQHITLQLPADYHLANKNESLTRDITISNTPITVVIERDGGDEPIKQAATLKLSIVDNKTGEVYSSQTISGYVGDVKKVDLTIPEYYHLIKGTLPSTVTLAAGTNEQSFLVESDYGPDIDQTIEFRDTQNRLIQSAKITAPENSTQNIDLKLPQGYHLLNGETLPKQITMNGKTIVIKIERDGGDEPIKQTSTITFVISDPLNKGAQTKQITGKIGTKPTSDELNFNPPYGYYLSDSTKQLLNNLTFTSEDQTINITFAKDPNAIGTLNVVYKTVDNQIVSQTKITNKLGTTYLGKDIFKIPAGYHLVNNDLNLQKYEISTENETIEVPVAKNQTPATEYGSLIIKFIDTDSNQEINETTLTGKVGEKLAYNLVIPSGYHLANGETLPNGNWTVTKGDQIHVIKLEKNAEPIQTGKVIVEFKNGNTTLKSITLTGKIGDTITVPTSDVPKHYHIADGQQTPTNVKISKNSQTVVINVVLNNAVLNISYVYNGQVIDHQTINGTYLQAVSFNVPKGYMLKDKNTTTTVVLRKEDTNMAVDVVPTIISRLIEFIDDDNQIVGKQTVSGNVGTTQSLILDIPEGYQAKSKVPASVTFDASNESPILIRVTKTVQYTNIIQLIDAQTGETIASQTYTGVAGETIPNTLKLPVDYDYETTTTIPESIKISDHNTTQRILVRRIKHNINPSDDTSHTVTKNVIVQTTSGQIVASFSYEGKPGTRQNISIAIPDGYHVVNGSLPTSITFDNSDTQQDVIVTVEKIINQPTTPITPNNPNTPSTPTKPSQPDPDKINSHDHKQHSQTDSSKSDNGDNQSATINTDNQHNNTTQNAASTQHISLDPNDLSSFDDQNVQHALAQELLNDNQTDDFANSMHHVDEIHHSQSSLDDAITSHNVRPFKDIANLSTQKTTTNKNEQKSESNTNSEDKKLPQTGNDSDKALQSFGLGLLADSGLALFGLSGKKKKKEDQ